MTMELEGLKVAALMEDGFEEVELYRARQDTEEAGVRDQGHIAEGRHGPQLDQGRLGRRVRGLCALEGR